MYKHLSAFSIKQILIQQFNLSKKRPQLNCGLFEKGRSGC